jgi:hypothetical protein
MRANSTKPSILWAGEKRHYRRRAIMLFRAIAVIVLALGGRDADAWR